MIYNMNDRDYHVCYTKLARAHLLMEEAAKLIADATNECPPSLDDKLEKLYQDVVETWNRTGDYIRE
jgi:hypothetical protein